jgi:long-chain acyl-CoA synthetase
MASQASNLVELLEQAASQFDARELFGTKQGGAWHWITYGEFKSQVDHCRGGLAALGVGPGDAVAIVSNNCVEWATAAFATFSLGAAFVPMYEVQPAKEWEFILQDSGAKVVFSATSAITEQLSSFRAACPKLEHLLGLHLPDGDPHSFAQLLAKGQAAPAESKAPDAQQVAGLIYTSGTTGMPKGVMLTHDNICFDLHASMSRFDVGPHDRSLAFLPWAHSFGQVAELYSLLSRGCSIAINDEVPNLVGNLAVVKPTVLVAVPRIFNRIYDGIMKQMAAKPKLIQSLFQAGLRVAEQRSNGQEVGFVDSLLHQLADKLIFSKVRTRVGGRLRLAISGSSALNKEVAKFVDALGIDVYEGYGLSETSPVATVNYPGNRKFGSVGKALPGVEILIDKSQAEDGKQGEILIRGRNVMKGYLNRPDETNEVLTQDGCLRSGDLGYLDDAGFLFLTGRIKEQYKLETGKYVAPAPLEEELKLSPFIANAMLYGDHKPHNVAIVVPDPVALKDWAKQAGVELGDIGKNAQVRELLQREVEKHSASFKSYEKPKALLVVEEDFSTDNEMLTPSLKLKRRNVLKRWGAELEQLYQQA